MDSSNQFEPEEIHNQEGNNMESEAAQETAQETVQDTAQDATQNVVQKNATRPRGQVPPPSPKKRNKPPKKSMHPLLVALCVVCGCIMFVTLWSNIFKGILSIGSMSSSAAYIPAGNTIDVIYVEGTIAEGQMSYNHIWTLNRIDTLIKNDSNKAIMLYVNSPGGGIYESDELYLKLKEYKEVTGRPVYAYMAQTAASGGLYVCMAADKIYANRMTMTGSIGVIMSLTDTTGLQKLIGIKTENIVSGKNKAMGNPLTDDQRAILQSMINESYEIFVDVIEEGRGMKEETVKKLADGRVYSALQAKEIGLIDEVTTFDTAVSQLKEAYNLDDCELYYDEQPVSFWKQLMHGVSNIGNLSAKNDFSTIKSYIDEKKEMKVMYMME